MSTEYFCNQIHLSMSKELSHQIAELEDEARYSIMEMLIQSLATDLKKQSYGGDYYLGEKENGNGGFIFHIHHPHYYNKALKDAVNRAKRLNAIKGKFGLRN